MGQSSAAGVTPHCAGAASPRRNLSEPWPISPKRFHEILRSRSFRNMRSRYGRPGTAVSSGRCPPPHRPPGTSRPRKKTPHDGGVFFYSGKSRISCASAGSRWERDRTRSSHKAGKLLHCHRSHRVSGRCPLPRSARRVPLPHAKSPRTMAGSFSIPAGAGSAALLQAVDGKGIEPEALIKPESCLIAVGHTEFPGVRPPTLCPPGTSRPRKKAPHDGGHSQVQKVDYGQPERQQRGSEILSGPLVLLSF